mgnify:CR=1 FL=1
MSRNPVIPYGIMAVIGIVAIIVISYVGVNHRQAQENPAEVVELDAEAIYKNQCAHCHGDDLSGLGAPALTEVGSKFSQEEITDIIIHGTDNGMPGGLVNNEQAEVIAEWLSGLE